MTGGPARAVVIVGGGTAGWMCAAALARFMPGLALRLVESEEIGTVGVGEATIPQIRLFNQGLGLDEHDFLRATQGTYKLGIRFDGWSGEGTGYIHAFGEVGRPLGLLPFHHYWLRHRTARGLPAAELWDYSAAALAASRNAFGAPPASAAAPPFAWAYHFDASLYAAYLRRYAEQRGVVRTEGKVAAVSRDPASSHVRALVLASGEEVAGDLFVDCSGFRGLLIEGELATGYEEWSHWLPCDRALAVPSASTGALAPFTRAIARDAGWQWRIPLQHRVGNGYVYASRHISDDEAAATLLASLDGEPLAEPRPLRFVTGRRRKAWNANVVALGLAAGFMEPLESTSIHLVQTGIARLLQLFPGAAGIAAAEREEYNRQTEAEWLAIRDFLILHYHANGRDGALWRGCRDMALPESLRHRIDLFRASGRLFRSGEELFTELAWLQVLIGQGIEPRAWHPLADAPSPGQLDEFLALARKQAALAVAGFADHRDFINRHCAAARMH